jgi:hypothetical protein
MLTGFNLKLLTMMRVPSGIALLANRQHFMAC